MANISGVFNNTTKRPIIRDAASTSSLSIVGIIAFGIAYKIHKDRSKSDG